MRDAFRAVSGEDVDPSQKARILAEGIAEAMNIAALSIGVSVLAGLWLAAFSWRYRWRSRQETED